MSPPFFEDQTASLPLLAALLRLGLGCFLCHCVVPPFRFDLLAPAPTAQQRRDLSVRSTCYTAPTLRGGSARVSRAQVPASQKKRRVPRGRAWSHPSRWYSIRGLSGSLARKM